jgi:TetR/AcrR family fatty acid metabolism transcriptional regulator
MKQEITKRQLEIISAAGKILSASGVSGLTIKNLAKEMGFSESAIYRHFTSKEQIILAMLDYLVDNMDGRYTKAISSELNPEQQFIALFQTQFSFFHHNPHFIVAVFSDGLMEESEQINSTILKIMAVKMKHLKPIIQKGQESQVFTSELSSEDLIHIIMGSIRLKMYKWRLANFQLDSIKEGDHLIHSLLTLIKTK